MENQNTPQGQNYHTISKEAVEANPILGHFGNLLLNESTIENLDQHPPHFPITEEYVLKTAETMHKHYSEMEILAQEDDWMYEELEEGIGAKQTELLTKLCYYIGWTKCEYHNF